MHQTWAAAILVGPDSEFAEGMTMHRRTAFVLALAVGPLGPSPGRTDDPAKDLADVLASGKWVKDLGEPPFNEMHVYTFAKDGTYTHKWETDQTTPTVKGKWELVPGKDGKVRLRLKQETVPENYGWLAPESVVRYDPKRDVLLVSGGRYVGEQPLRHVKGDKKDK